MILVESNITQSDYCKKHWARQHSYIMSLVDLYIGVKLCLQIFVLSLAVHIIKEQGLCDLFCNWAIIESVVKTVKK